MSETGYYFVFILTFYIYLAVFCIFPTANHIYPITLSYIGRKLT